jgi:hypothetical protein
MDSTIKAILRRLYQDGYRAANDPILTKDRASVSKAAFPTTGPRELVMPVLRFAHDNFRAWTSQSPSYFRRPIGLLLLYMLGLSRQIGWLAGQKRFRSDILGS